MSERLTTCPLCRSTAVQTVKVLNPETTDLNARATLHCEECSHTWEGRVTSPHTEEQRKRGFLL